MYVKIRNILKLVKHNQIIGQTTCMLQDGQTDTKVSNSTKNETEKTSYICLQMAKSNHFHR